MAKEAFSVDFEKASYHRRPIVGDEVVVFAAREQETRNNVLRYLGEYRLAVKFDEFFYREGTGSDGKRFLAAIEEAPVSERFRNAIYQKEREGQNPKREVAECLGFQKIEDKFLAGEDFLFLWISPPGNKEDGYGDYSFSFMGEVKDNKIRVVPYRNQLSLDKHREVAGIFSNQADNLATDVDFLNNPIFIDKQEGRKSVEDLLVEIGERERIDLSWRQRLEGRLRGLMDMFVDAVKRNASDIELQKIKRTIENFTIDKKTEIISGEYIQHDFDTRHLIDAYGNYAPPVVGGSCGSSSSSTLMEFQKALNPEPDKYGDRVFDCPECGKTNVRPKDELIKNCQHCGTSKVAC